MVAGPDAGGVHLLHGGQIRIGRSADADVPLDDPDVSRLHCAVTVSGDGRVTVADLGSTNGTSLDGAEIGTRPVPLSAGALLRLGESTLRLTTGPRPPALATAPDGEGHLRVARPEADGPDPAHGHGSFAEEPRPAGHDSAFRQENSGPFPRPGAEPARRGGISAWARRLAGGRAGHEAQESEAVPAPGPSRGTRGS